jgi:hypothetical protein
MGNNNNCLSFFCCVCLKKKIQKTNELTDNEIKILKKKTKLNRETIINWHELFIVSEKIELFIYKVQFCSCS